MTTETLKKHLENLKEKGKINEINEIGKALELRAKAGSLNAMARLDVYQEVMSDEKKEKSKKSK